VENRYLSLRFLNSDELAVLHMVFQRYA